MITYALKIKHRNLPETSQKSLLSGDTVSQHSYRKTDKLQNRTSHHKFKNIAIYHPAPNVQSKLNFNSQNDRHEKEASRTAQEFSNLTENHTFPARSIIPGLPCTISHKEASVAIPVSPVREKGKKEDKSNSLPHKSQLLSSKGQGLILSERKELNAFSLEHLKMVP